MIQTNENSKNIYYSLIAPTLSDRQKVVLNYFTHFDEGTAKEVARFLNVELNTISGRFSELRKLNFIREKNKRRENSMVYELNNEKQMSLL
jgi:Fic family protein